MHDFDISNVKKEDFGFPAFEKLQPLKKIFCLFYLKSPRMGPKWWNISIHCKLGEKELLAEHGELKIEDKCLTACLLIHGFYHEGCDPPPTSEWAFSGQHRRSCLHTNTHTHRPTLLLLQALI